MYFQAKKDTVVDMQVNLDPQDVGEGNQLSVDEMKFPTVFVRDVSDEVLKGVVTDNRYTNTHYGFSFVIPENSQLSYEKSEQWNRIDFGDYYRHYLKFSYDDKKYVTVNTEAVSYNDLDTWVKTDEGRYRLYGDVVVEPTLQKFSDTNAVVFDNTEFNTYTLYLIKNNVLYEISINGFLIQEQ